MLQFHNDLPMDYKLQAQNTQRDHHDLFSHKSQYFDSAMENKYLSNWRKNVIDAFRQFLKKKMRN